MQITLIFVVIILVLVLANVFSRKLASVSLLVLNLLLILLVVAALVALFVPDVFKQVSESALGNNLLGIQLKYLDTTISNASNLPSGIIDTIGSLFQQPSTNQPTFQSQLYPQLVEIVAGLLRWGVLLVSVVLMGIVTYLRFSFSGLGNTKHLEDKITRLEARITLLEQPQAPRLQGMPQR